MSEKKKTKEELLQEQNTDQKSSAYAVVRDELLDELLNAQPFEFDLNADALYKQYRDSYIRQGREEAGNAFGQAATLTGGYANSYAQSVAAQTYDSYMLALQDKGAEIYENAYSRYADEADRKTDLYKLVQSLENEEYDRRTQEEKTEYDRKTQEEKTEYDRKKQEEETAYDRKTQEEKTEYERKKREEETAYDRKIQEEKTEYDRKKQEEETAYDRIQDAEKQAYEKEQDLLSFAYKMAQLGDFSYLDAMGVDISQLQAQVAAKADEPEKISVTVQNTAEETYQTAGYAALVRYLDRQIAYGQITEKGKNQILKALTKR